MFKNSSQNKKGVSGETVKGGVQRLEVLVVRRWAIGRTSDGSSEIVASGRRWSVTRRLIDKRRWLSKMGGGGSWLLEVKREGGDDEQLVVNIAEITFFSPRKSLSF